MYIYYINDKFFCKSNTEIVFNTELFPIYKNLKVKKEQKVKTSKD